MSAPGAPGGPGAWGAGACCCGSLRGMRRGAEAHVQPPPPAPGEEQLWLCRKSLLLRS